MIFGDDVAIAFSIRVVAIDRAVNLQNDWPPLENQIAVLVGNLDELAFAVWRVCMNLPRCSPFDRYVTRSNGSPADVNARSRRSS